MLTSEKRATTYFFTYLILWGHLEAYFARASRANDQDDIAADGGSERDSRDEQHQGLVQATSDTSEVKHSVEPAHSLLILTKATTLDEAIATYSSNSSMVMVAGQLTELERKEQVVVLAIASVVIGVIALCVGIGSLVHAIMSTMSKLPSKNDVNARKARLTARLEALAAGVRLWGGDKDTRGQVVIFKAEMERICAAKNCNANKGSIEANPQYQHALTAFTAFKRQLQIAKNTVEKVKADFALGLPETPYDTLRPDGKPEWFNKKWTDMFDENKGQTSYLWFKGRGMKEDLTKAMYRRFAENSWGWASDAVQRISKVWEDTEQQPRIIMQDFALEYNGLKKQSTCCTLGTNCDKCPCDDGWDAGCLTTRRCLICENGEVSNAIFSKSEISDNTVKAVNDINSVKTDLFQLFQTVTTSFQSWKADLE
jgi:hypothetical protein